MSEKTRVALIATADVGNFGDMLFPDLAEEALARRLGDVAMTVYGFRRMGGDDWPRPVEALSTLSMSLPETDLLVIGGGDLIRFVKPLAPGYGPTEPGVHDPTGLWLTPTLLASVFGVPVIWSAVGARGQPPDWLRLPGKAAVDATALAAVRDGESVEALRRLSPDAAPRIVPDTAFGVAEVIPTDESHAMTEWRRATGVDGGYAIVQAAPQLRDSATQLRAFADGVRGRGLTLLQLPISPALGDVEGALGDIGPLAASPAWPAPLLLAEIVSHAEAVAAQSLHLSIVAAASGVPVHRPLPEAGEKYGLVTGLPGVHVWGRDDGMGPIGRSAPSVAVRELAAQVAGYWDDVATRVQRRETRVPAAVGTLLTHLPFELEALRAAVDEGSRFAARAAEADELQRRRDELEDYTMQLRARIAELERGLTRRIASRVYTSVRRTKRS
jgi:hypothetical protein